MGGDGKREGGREGDSARERERERGERERRERGRKVEISLSLSLSLSLCVCVCASIHAYVCANAGTSRPTICACGERIACAPSSRAELSLISFAHPTVEQYPLRTQQ